MNVSHVVGIKDSEGAMRSKQVAEDPKVLVVIAAAREAHECLGARHVVGKVTLRTH